VLQRSDDRLEMKWNSLGFLEPALTGLGDIDPDVVKYCPFNKTPDPEIETEDELSGIFLKDAPEFDNKLGRYFKNYIGYSNEFRESSSSGGLATSILNGLLIDGIVSGIFVVTEVDGSYGYQMMVDVEDITTISKTRYIPVTLVELFEKINEFEGAVAVTGVACFIKAIRIRKYYDPTLISKIPFLIGIICGGWKSRFFTDFLSVKTGIEAGYSHQDYRIKEGSLSAYNYSYGAFDKSDGEFKTIKMKELGDRWGTGLFKSPACDFCSDVMNELCDISWGDAWIAGYKEDNKGHSIAIVRTQKAMALIASLIAEGDLKLEDMTVEKMIESQSSSFYHRQDTLAFRVLPRKLFLIPSPPVRNRLKSNISPRFSLVQICRLVTRKSSLYYWKSTSGPEGYSEKMKLFLKLLFFTTKIYHKLRRFGL